MFLDRMIYYFIWWECIFKSMVSIIYHCLMLN